MITNEQRVLNEKHLAELRASGISEEIIARSGIYSASDEVIGEALGWRPGHCLWGEGYIIPFMNGDTGDKPYARVKLDFPRRAAGKTIKYESPRGRTNRAYFPPGFQQRLESSRVLLITEGEKKALAAAGVDVACLGLVGVWGWQAPRPKNDDGKAYGKRALIADLQAISWKGIKVIIIFDSDASANRMVQMAEFKLAEVLTGMGADVRVVRLRSEGGKKVGLDDYLLCHGAVALGGLIENATPAEQPPEPTLMDIARMYLHDAWQWPEGVGLRWWRDDFWAFDGRRYVSIPDAEIRGIVLRWLDENGQKATPHMAANVTLCLQSLCQIPSADDQPTFLDDAVNCSRWVLMANGILDVEAAVLEKATCIRPHDVRFFTPVSLPYGYDRHAGCPRFLKWLGEVMRDDEELIALLQEWTGYCLVHDTSYHKFMLLVGEGGNGKSVFLDVLVALLGEVNVSHVPLESFGERFQLTASIGKLANTIAEVGELAKPNEAAFKAFVAGDPMMFDRKGKSMIQARPTARVTIATNTQPRWADRSDGIWRRMLMVTFDVTIPEERQDRNLARSIINEELAGVFNWAIQGLARLRQQGRFTEAHASREAMVEYRTDINPARVFFEQECEADPTAHVPSGLLYSAYAKWCRDRGYQPLNDSNFGKELRRVFRQVERFQQPVGGGRKVRCLRGIWCALAYERPGDPQNRENHQNHQNQEVPYGYEPAPF